MFANIESLDSNWHSKPTKIFLLKKYQDWHLNGLKDKTKREIHNDEKKKYVWRK